MPRAEHFRGQADEIIVLTIINCSQKLCIYLCQLEREIDFVLADRLQTEEGRRFAANRDYFCWHDFIYLWSNVVM